MFPGVICSSTELDIRTAEAGESKYCDCTRGQQNRPGEPASSSVWRMCYAHISSVYSVFCLWSLFI